MTDLPKTLLIVLGTLFVALGVIGIVVPVLPTTPFLLLAAVCYAKSSQRFYEWLMTNRVCGEYIRNYREGKGIALRHKVFAILFLWLTIGYAAWFVTPQWWVKVILLGIAVGVTVHLTRMITYQPEDQHPEPISECDLP